MNKFELTICLVFALFLWNWRDLIPGAASTNAGQEDSAIASLDVTYVPDAKLSDAKSWSAWETTAKRADSTESYVKPVHQSPETSSAPSFTTAKSDASSPDRGHAVSVTPTQNLWEGESWADGISIKDPEAEASPQTSTTSSLNAVSPKAPEVAPNLLPNFWEEGSRRAATKTAVTTSLQPKSSSTSKMTVISVPVTVASPSSSSTAIAAQDSAFALDDTVGFNTLAWGVLLPSFVASFGVAGVGYLLLQRRDRHANAELSSPHFK